MELLSLFLLFRDKMGTSTFFCKAAYLQEPEATFGTDSTTREWSLICNEVSHVIGSNQQDDKIANILSTITSAIGVAGAFGIDVGQFVGNAIGSATSLINGVR